MGAAACGVADHSSASACTVCGWVFQAVAKPRARNNKACATPATTQARPAPGCAGGANSRCGVALAFKPVSLLKVPVEPTGLHGRCPRVAGCP